MNQTQLHPHQRYLIEEFAEAYQEKRMSRRDLIRRVVYLTGSLPLTASMLLALGCGTSNDEEPLAAAPTTPAQPTAVPTAVGPGVTANDPLIEGRDVSYAGPASQVLGYLARPKAEGKYPGVVVIHENQGLMEHFKDIARRFAREGFVALAPDMVSRLGGTNEDRMRTMLAFRASDGDLTADLVAGVTYLKQQPFVNANALGVTGYCMGGSFTWELAIASPDMKAAVPYYGSLADLDRLSQTRAAVLAIYAENDTRITSQAQTVADKLRSFGRTAEVKIYAGAGHGFFNDTSARGHNPEASRDAWIQTLAWFRKYLTS